MRIYKPIPFAAAILVSCLKAHAAHELSLFEALSTAEQHSPQLKASVLREEAAREGVGAARSNYFPSIDLDGVDSWGFPGSTGWLGLGGLVGSPYRSGPAAGVAARGTVFDFGRTSAGVRAAEFVARQRGEEIAIDRYTLDQDVVQTFYECSRYRSEHEAWDMLHAETELVAKEIAGFVSTGQRSVVDRYLSQAQVEEARTNRNYFRSRMRSTADRLAMLMGTAEKGLACPSLPKLDENVPLHPTSAVNPYVLRAETDVESAKNHLTAAKADYLPKIVGVASFGAMDEARLVDRKDYSAGIGLVVPLFDGLGTVRRVGQARAELEARTEQLDAVHLQMDELNARFDEIIDASKARIEHLEREQKLAQEGYSVAKSRYFKFQGTLVDLRDALRNLGRIETDIRDTQANFLEATGSKALLNGSAAAQPGTGRERP